MPSGCGLDQTSRQSGLVGREAAAGRLRRARQAVQSIVSDLEETKFDGGRYTFQALVESAESARRIGDRLQVQFDEGRTLVGSEALSAIRREAYADGE